MKQAYSISFTTNGGFDAKAAEMLRRDIARTIVKYGGDDISVKQNNKTNNTQQPIEIHETSSAKSRYDIFSDGSCLGNPGAGGWAALIREHGKPDIKISGGAPNTTNNRMEITAVIEALRRIPAESEVVITTDSKYVTDSFNKHWIDNWKKNGWKNAKGTTVLNIDLWTELLSLLAQHPYSFKWVKGHNSCAENKECDKMAVSAAKKAEHDHTSK